MKTEFDDRAENWDKDKIKVERGKRVADKILEILPPKDDLSAMEFGCGTGLVGFNLIDHMKKITFADISDKMLEQVKIKIDENKIKNAELLDLSINGIKGSFDLIFSLLALHHIEDYRTTLREISESVNKNGFVVICDLDKEDGSFHGEEVPHNGFERSDIEDILKDVGLKIILSDVVYVMEKENKEFPIFMIAGKKVNK